MDHTNAPRRIAIACQGGGSHTAFTAGALKSILKSNPQQYEIMALSGTSGGAICALLTWANLLTGDRDGAISTLDAFWNDTSAHFFYDMLLNNWVVLGSRLQDVVTMPAVNPYFYPPWGQVRLQLLIEKYVDFAQIPHLVTATSPDLLISAIDVLSGEFKIFRNTQVNAEVILASAALPTLFRAVHTGGGVYWDGLFSQNPPIREFIAGKPDSQHKPDEIWIIQINPQRRSEEPMAVQDIQDRRNELSGNLALNQEIYFIERMNQFLAEGILISPRYKPVTVRRLLMTRELDYASKLDRNPSFIQDLIADGEATATAFLKELESSKPV